MNRVSLCILQNLLSQKSFSEEGYIHGNHKHVCPSVGCSITASALSAAPYSISSSHIPNKV